jgi:hypothetical protein
VLLVKLSGMELLGLLVKHLNFIGRRLENA